MNPPVAGGFYEKLRAVEKMMHSSTPIRRARPDFAKINALALARLPELVHRWIPGGRREGLEYVVRNPLRADDSLGSFKINLRSGRWADFATGDKGGDVISLAAYVAGLSQLEAARQLERMLGNGGR